MKGKTTHYFWDSLMMLPWVFILLAFFIIVQPIINASNNTAGFVPKERKPNLFQRLFKKKEVKQAKTPKTE